MNEILRANVFFFITSVAVVVLTAALLVVLFYIIVILREVRVVARRVRQASENLEKDIESFRFEVKGGVEKAFSFLHTIAGFVFGRGVMPKKRPTTRKKNVNETDHNESV